MTLGQNTALVPRGRWLSALAAMLSALVLFSAAPSANDDGSNTFLNPFPENEVYQVTVIGSVFAEGIRSGLIESMGQDTRLNIEPKVMQFPGVMMTEFDDRIREFEKLLSSSPVNIAIVMLGEYDRLPLKSSSGRRIQIGSDEWLAEYARRVDRLMKSIKTKNPGVYWVGLPNVARAESNEQVQKVNDAIREKAYLNGFKYIDSYAGFADEAGGYSAYGPDLQGKIRVLRQRDGLHFTEAGTRKLAHFVEKELRRDLNQAKSNRSVPLLGAEPEQAKVNPDNAVKTPAPSSPAATSAAIGVPIVKAAPVSGTPPPEPASTVGDQKADNSRIAVKIATADGREETLTIDIVRPAIPGSVVALMSRRETASQLGDLIVEQLPGGLTLMNSIAPSGNKARGKLSPAQAPYFRLLVKGERLTPKPGRADDTAWPRGDNATSADPAGRQPKG